MTAPGSRGWSRQDPRAAVAAASPAVAALVDRLTAAGADSELGAAIVAAVPAQHGLPPARPDVLVGPPWRHRGWSEPERVALLVAEQFALDVTGIDDELRLAFTDAWGADSFALVQLMYAADQVPRVVAALARLFGGGDAWVPEGSGGPPVDLWPVIDELSRLVWNLGALDPVTTEVVRLHGARQHRCRLCMSLRSHSALAAGADDGLFAAIDTPGDLGPRHAAARALADSMIWTPARIDEVTVAGVRGNFTPAEATEIVLDVMRNAANKIAVALGVDEARVTEGVDIYDIDADGTMRQGLEAPAPRAAGPAPDPEG